MSNNEIKYLAVFDFYLKMNKKYDSYFLKYFQTYIRNEHLVYKKEQLFVYLKEISVQAFFFFFTILLCYFF